MGTSKAKYISLFTGAMGLDLGLEMAGLDPAACVEIDHDCCRTIAKNRPTIPVIENDLTKVSTAEILDAARLSPGEAFAVVGGPPCQSFSTGGLRQSVKDKRGGLFEEFVRVVRDAQPLYFVFENVAQLITAAAKHRPIAERPGQRWHLSSYKHKNTSEDDGSLPLSEEEQAGSALKIILEAFDELGYSLSLGILNSANYGVSQRRFRLIIIGSRIVRHVPLPQPTHAEEGKGGKPRWRTLRDALDGLKEESPLHSNYTPEFQRYFAHVPPGGNWRALPREMQIIALGEKAFNAGGGKTGFFRRLSWDEPAPTMVGKPNRKSCAFCHPEHNRPLTVREMARIQGFPDEWEFIGSMHSQYLQVGNAVPVGLGQAVGKALLDSYRKVQKLKDAQRELEHLREWHLQKEAMIEDARNVLRAAARNKLSKKASAEQGFLFS